jgi:hypothetical protein
VIRAKWDLPGTEVGREEGERKVGRVGKRRRGEGWGRGEGWRNGPNNVCTCE